MDQTTATQPINTQPNQANDNPFQPYTPPSPPPSVTAVFSQEKPKSQVPDKKVVIVGISVLLLGGLVFGISKFTGLLSKAAGAGSCEPENMQEGSLTANSVEITFQTAKACQTKITYGTSAQPEALLLEVPEAMASLNHRFKLSPLLPSTTYYYQVNADDKAVGTMGNILTSRAEGGAGVSDEIAPPPPPPETPAETPSEAPATSSGELTFEDFQKYFGTSNATYDINKDKIVNYADWNTYQKTR